LGKGERTGEGDVFWFFFLEGGWGGCGRRGFIICAFGEFLSFGAGNIYFIGLDWMRREVLFE
jgi:hypothetical protein